MKDIFSISIVVSILAGFAMFAGVGIFYVLTLQSLHTEQTRNAAIDGCMQNARFAWQERNPQNSELVNETDEPSRFWYKLCMEEKGQDVRIKI